MDQNLKSTEEKTQENTGIFISANYQKTSFFLGKKMKPREANPMAQNFLFSHFGEVGK